MCAGAIVMNNLRTVRFAARDPWAGSTDLYQANHYLQSKHMRVEGPMALEPLLFAMQTAYFLAERARRDLKANSYYTIDPLLDCMTSIHPAAVELGQSLYQNGMLEQMRVLELPVSHVLHSLQAMLAVP
jgi:tRNA(adenine34) deaminase